MPAILKIIKRIRNPLLLAGAVFLWIALPGRAQFGAETAWRPVTEAEKRMTAPVVDPEAGVEAIFWRVFVGDEPRGDELQRVLYHYVRLKVFNEQGREKASTVDLEYDGDTQITDVSGRTITPEGEIVELTEDAVHDRVIAKYAGVRRRARSLAMPTVRPGAIVEYRWRERRGAEHLEYMRLQFQRDIPVQKVTYFIRPLPRRYTGSTMRIAPFNFEMTPLTEESNGYVSTFLENAPAFREEPFLPSEATIRPWALIYYHRDKPRDPEAYWRETGRKRYGKLRIHLRADGELKRAAVQAAEGAANDEDKVQHLLRFIRGTVRDYNAGGVTDAERWAVAKQRRLRGGDRFAPEILKSGIATASELNLLLTAMAVQAGLEARPALVSNENDVPFNPALMEDYFLPRLETAVRIGGAWKVYDAYARWLPPGMPYWQEQGATALVTDPEEPEFVKTPAPAPEQTAVVRRAKMTLSSEGALEGDVEEEWSGYKGAERRLRLLNDSDARREEQIREESIEAFPSAEVTAIRVEHVEDPARPLKVRYHIRIPAYAQRTGKRLLLQPFVFQRGEEPLFAAAERRYPIRFRYAWRERDDLEIKLPAGFEVEQAEAPGVLDLGPAGRYDAKLAFRNRDELVVERELVFGAGGALSFPQAAYSRVKQAFDAIHNRDQSLLIFGICDRNM